MIRISGCSNVLGWSTSPSSSCPAAPRTSPRELRRLHVHFPEVRTVNLPDLTRFSLRSWQACALAQPTHPRAIPHLRACDVDLLDEGREGRLGLTELKGLCARHRFREVIVVQGDEPEAQALGARTPRSVELIAALHEGLPDLAIYAALDPYRASPQRERDYALEKREAGACGFFTQPFFDLRYLEVWDDLLAGETLYWGLTPILTPGNRRYWERRNRAFLPSDFEPTLAWNRDHARRVIAWAEAQRAALYFMPIRADLVDWVGGLLPTA